MNTRWITTCMVFATIFITGFEGHFTTADGKMLVPEKELTIEGKKPAKFKHTTHMKLELKCGTCHHNAKHEPLTAEAIAGFPDGKKLQCINCHNKDFSNPKLQKKKDVFHARCKTCHKSGIDGKKGPTKCSACHPRKKKAAIEGC